MKTKVVYCLVSNDSDYYYEQLLISLCSFRKHNPSAQVEVICDESTFATLKGTRATIYEYNVNVVSVETPVNWKNWERSRYLKTNLRKLTQGDFLYIDTDTIISSALDFIDDFTFEISAVLESHLDRPLPPCSKCQHLSEGWMWGEAKKANLDIAGMWHFNSGVMYVKDTKNTHDLYAKWSETYSALLRQNIKFDQLSLLLSNHEMCNIIVPLDPKLNCQITEEKGRALLSNAKIIHWFTGRPTILLPSPWIMDPIKETGRINVCIQKIIDDPYSFFKDESYVVKGDKASLISTPSLYGAYKYSPKVFKAFASLLDAYVRTKINIHKWISCF